MGEIICTLSKLGQKLNKDRVTSNKVGGIAPLGGQITWGVSKEKERPLEVQMTIWKVSIAGIKLVNFVDLTNLLTGFWINAPSIVAVLNFTVLLSSLVGCANRYSE